MASHLSHLDRFLRAVHRRLVVMRVLERIGIGILLASVAGAILIPILMWRGQSAMTLAMFTITLGAMAGLVWGATRRPTMLESAMEADRQLGLADLLGTALAIEHSNDNEDGWARTVHAIAEARCAEVMPSSVIVNRLGARAWGGIGLSAALVLTLGLISVTITPTRQDALATTAQQNGAPGERAPAVVSRDRTFASRAHDGSVRGASSDDRSRMSTPSSDDNAATHDTTTRFPGSGNSGTSGRDGVGPGNARSTLAARPSEAHRPAGTNAEPTANTADSPTAGVGRPGDASNSDDAIHAPAVAGQSATPSAPPWKSPIWPAAQSAAMESVRSNRVPAPYHALVREYFDRSE